MKKKMAEYLSIAILALALLAPGVWAQQQDPRVNPPAAPQKPLSTTDSGTRASGEAGAPGKEQTPDTSPLSGAELFTLGQLQKTRSYVLASFQVFEAADTNAGVTNAKSSLVSATTLLGHIALQRVRGRYQFTTDYRGGGVLYSPQSDLDTHLHEFGLSQKIAWRRWTLVLRDQLSYLPEASFGFGEGAGTGSILRDLNPIFVPNQSILTSRAKRISNTTVAEVSHVLSRKSSFTVSAAYAILQFLNSPSFLNSRNASFLAGYEYAPSPRNTVALNYGFSMFQYGTRGRQIYDHLLHVAYGRRITGRLALELSVGPELYMFKTPVLQNPLLRSGTRVSWGMESALLYRWPKTNVKMAYASYLTGGGGVLPGAQTHEVRFTADRRLSRVWSGNLDLGYARNASLPETAPQSANLVFNTLFGGIGLRRPIGRHMNVSLFYRAERQSVVGVCTVSTVTTCGKLPVRHHFNLGFEWRNRPYSLD